MSKCIIECKNVCFSYTYFEKQGGMCGTIKDFFGRQKKKITAINNVDFMVNRGEIVCILGANGAGKTTLMKLLIGILSNEKGDIHCNGYKPYSKDKEYLKSIGVVLGQKSQLIWDLPPIDTLKMLKEIYEIPKKDFEKRLNELVNSLKVSEKLRVPVRKLSLGERVKFELICALIHKPEILFLDEPTLGLDIVSQKFMYEFLQKINRVEKTTILFSSHYIQDIENLAKRVIVIKKGSIISDTSLSELKSQYTDKTSYIVETDGTELSMSMDGASLIKDENNKYRIFVTDKEPIVNFMNLKNVISIHKEEMELEDILVSIFCKE